MSKKEHEEVQRLRFFIDSCCHHIVILPLYDSILDYNLTRMVKVITTIVIYRQTCQQVTTDRLVRLFCLSTSSESLSFFLFFMFSKWRSMHIDTCLSRILLFMSRRHLLYIAVSVTYFVRCVDSALW